MKVRVWDGAQRGQKTHTWKVWDVELSDADHGWKTLERFKPLDAKDFKNLKKLPILHTGFVDSHLHLAWQGEMLGAPQGTQCESPTEYFSKILEASESEQIVRAFSWDESRWDLSAETLQNLFENLLSKNISCVALRVCGHSAFVSANLLEKHAPQFLPRQHKSFVLLKDHELYAALEKFPQPSLEKKKDWIQSAMTELYKKGVNAVSDMSLEDDLFQAHLDLLETSTNLIDVRAVLLDGAASEKFYKRGPFSQLSKNESEFLGRRSEFHSKHWKRYLDGSFGSRTAWLKEAYSDEVGQFGLQNYQEQELFEKSQDAIKRGFDLSFHAIGDAALEQALNLGEKLLKNGAKADEQNRIEHVQLASSTLLDRFKAQKFWQFHVQPLHEFEDAGFILKRLGERRRLEAYPLFRIQAQGIPYALSSDAPVADFDPIKTLDAALNAGESREALRFETAFDAMTTGARKLLGFEDLPLKEGAKLRLTELTI